MSVYNEHEISEINYTVELRKKMIDELTEGRMPSDPAELRIVLSALSSIDKITIESAKLRIREGESDDAKANTELMSKLLLSLDAPHRSTVDTLSEEMILEDLPDVGDEFSLTEKELELPNVEADI